METGDQTEGTPRCLLEREASCGGACVGEPPTLSTGRWYQCWTEPEDKGNYCWRRPYTNRWHLQRSASTRTENRKSWIAGLYWWGDRKGGAIITDSWPPMTLNDVSSVVQKKEERRKKNIFTILLLSGLVLLWCFSAPQGVLLVMKALEDGWYIVINAYKLTVFEIWGDIFVLSYIACPCYPYIRVYRLYDILCDTLLKLAAKAFCICTCPLVSTDSIKVLGTVGTGWVLAH